MADGVRRCAVVTGAAQGIGRAIALRLLEDGACVIGADLQGDKLQAMSQELGDAGQRFRPVTGDMGSEAGADAAVAAAISAFGRIDILVNTAGGSGHQAFQQVDHLPPAVWNSVIAANLGSTFNCIHATVPHMRKARYGRIVNFSSSLTAGSRVWSATVGARLAYCAAKSGIDGLSRQLALDLAPVGITVNVIVPSLILTEPGARVRDRFDAVTAEEKQMLLGGRDVSAIATPSDIARAVAFLTAEDAGNLNGVFLQVGHA